MFKNALAFNSLIFTVNSGTQTAARDVTSMFEGASAFNQDISTWTVTLLTTFTKFLKNAISFNQNIGTWTLFPSANPSFYTDMFNGATNFQQNLCHWQTIAAASFPAGDVTGMFTLTNCPIMADPEVGAPRAINTGSVCCNCASSTLPCTT